MPKIPPNIISSILPILTLAGTLASVGQARAQPLPAPPFTETLSNAAPLAFGMTPGDAARALGKPLAFVSGTRGDNIYLAISDVGGGGFFARRDRLFLQFRRDRLTGWKGDWGRNWMWP